MPYNLAFFYYHIWLIHSRTHTNTHIYVIRWATNYRNDCKIYHKFSSGILNEIHWILLNAIKLKLLIKIIYGIYRNEIKTQTLIHEIERLFICNQLESWILGLPRSFTCDSKKTGNNDSWFFQVLYDFSFRSDLCIHSSHSRNYSNGKRFRSLDKEKVRLLSNNVHLKERIQKNFIKTFQIHLKNVFILQNII